MASRSFLKGYLKLSLVTCSVAMTPATTENEKVRFHTLNRKTGNRVVSQYVDALSGKPVKEDDELEAVGLESTRTIDIEMFVPADTIDLVWYEKPHYLVPDEPVGEEAFAVIREAMAATRTVGISRLVMSRRERAVMLEPRGRGIVLWTLRYGDEVWDAKDYFGALGDKKTDPKLIELFGTLIDGRTKPWDPKMVDDPVQSDFSISLPPKRRAGNGRDSQLRARQRRRAT